MFNACLAVALAIPLFLVRNASPEPAARRGRIPDGARAAETEAGTGLGRLRPTDPILQEVIGDACKRSPGFRNVLSRLGRRDGFVYLHWTSSQMDGRRGARARELPSGSRCLFVLLRHTGNRARLAATIAHELQHAVEALQSTARDAAGMERHFRKIGHDNGRAFETDEAGEIGALVQREMKASARRRQVANHRLQPWVVRRESQSAVRADSRPSAVGGQHSAFSIRHSTPRLQPSRLNLRLLTSGLPSGTTRLRLTTGDRLRTAD